MSPNPTSVTTLVTGGCGYLGRQLCLRLLALGHHVWIIDNLSNGAHPDIWLQEAISERRTDAGRIHYRLGPQGNQDSPTLTFVQQELATLLQQPQALNKGPEGQAWPPHFAAVFHLANVKDVGPLRAPDPLGVAQKLAMDGQLFAWASTRRNIIGRLIYVSPLCGSDCHDVMSLAARTGEQLAQLIAQHGQVATACVRLSCLYGKDQPATQVMPMIAHLVLRAQQEVRLPEPLLKAKDFLHVDDAVAGLLMASEHVRDGRLVEIASGRATELHEVARKLARLHNSNLHVVPQGAGISDAQRETPSTTSSLHEVGFAPKVVFDSALSQVLRTAERREQRLAQGH